MKGDHKNCPVMTLETLFPLNLPRVEINMCLINLKKAFQINTLPSSNETASVYSIWMAETSKLTDFEMCFLAIFSRARPLRPRFSVTFLKQMPRHCRHEDPLSASLQQLHQWEVSSPREKMHGGQWGSPGPRAGVGGRRIEGLWVGSRRQGRQPASERIRGANKGPFCEPAAPRLDAAH